VGIGNPGGHLRGDPRGQAESLHLTVRFDGLGQGQRQEQVLLLLVVWSGRHTLTMQLCHAHHTILILTLHPLLVGGEVTQFGAIEGHVHRGSWQFGYLKGAQGGTTTINLAHFVDFIFRRASTKKLAPSVFECQKCSG